VTAVPRTAPPEGIPSGPAVTVPPPASGQVPPGQMAPVQVPPGQVGRLRRAHRRQISHRQACPRSGDAFRVRPRQRMNSARLGSWVVVVALSLAAACTRDRRAAVAATPGRMSRSWGLTSCPIHSPLDRSDAGGPHCPRRGLRLFEGERQPESGHDVELLNFNRPVDLKFEPDDCDLPRGLPERARLRPVRSGQQVHRSEQRAAVQIPGPGVIWRSSELHKSAVKRGAASAAPVSIAAQARSKRLERKRVSAIKGRLRLALRWAPSRNEDGVTPRCSA
jgi:hypothetical protein